jgi:hypothetical protein
MDIRTGRARKLTALLAIGLMFLSPGGLVGGLAAVAAAMQTPTHKTHPDTDHETGRLTPPLPPPERRLPSQLARRLPSQPQPRARRRQRSRRRPHLPAGRRLATRVLLGKGARLIIYQPQVATWTDQVQMVAYSAVSYTPKARRNKRSARSS